MNKKPTIFWLSFLAIAAFLFLGGLRYTVSAYKYIRRPLLHHQYTVWIGLAANDRIEQIRQLASRGVDINVAGSDGLTPLLWLLLHKPVNMSVLEAFLASGADPSMVVQEGKYRGLSAIYLAASSKMPDVLKKLLAYGGEPNVRNPNEKNQTALIAAVGQGLFGQAKMLVKDAANVSDVDIDGVSAVFKAMQHKRFDIAYYLLYNGAEYQSKAYVYSQNAKVDLSGVLMCASLENLDIKQSREHDKVVAWLKRRGIEAARVEPDQIPDCGQVSASILRRVTGKIFSHPGVVELAVAAMQGDASKVRNLVHSGVDVNAVGRRGETPLSWVGGQDSANLAGFEALLKNGANPNYTFEEGGLEGYSLVYLASGAVDAWRDPKLLELLLKYGGDPDDRNSQDSNWTPLMYAARYGRLAQVKVLVEHGANMDALSGNGANALFVAIYENYLDVANYLLKKGADYAFATESSSVADLVREHFCKYNDLNTNPDARQLVKWLRAHKVKLDIPNSANFSAVCREVSGDD